MNKKILLSLICFMGFAPLTPEAITEIQALRGEALSRRLNALYADEEGLSQFINSIMSFQHDYEGEDYERAVPCAPPAKFLVYEVIKVAEMVWSTDAVLEAFYKTHSNNDGIPDVVNILRQIHERTRGYQIIYQYCLNEDQRNNLRGDSSPPIDHLLAIIAKSLQEVQTKRDDYKAAATLYLRRTFLGVLIESLNEQIITKSDTYISNLKINDEEKTAKKQKVQSFIDELKTANLTLRISSLKDVISSLDRKIFVLQEEQVRNALSKDEEADRSELSRVKKSTADLLNALAVLDI